MYVFRQLDSRGQRPRERFDYWRSTVYPWTVDLEGCGSPNDYCADMRWVTTPDGMHLQDSRADATRTCITPQRCRADYGDHIIGFYGLRRGRFEMEQANGEITTIDENMLCLLDGGRPMRMQYTQHHDLALIFPRDELLKAVGGRLFTSGGSLRRLEWKGVTPLLWNHMAWLADHGAALNTDERCAALETVRELALAALRSVAGAAAARDQTRNAHVLYTAARQYLQRNYALHDLTAEKVAGALGSSRARLYRAFAQHSTTVADLLRDIRMQRARALLQSGASTVSQVAHACGYGDTSAFGRAFRACEGMSPGDWRASRKASQN